MANKPGLVARMFGRAPKHPVVTTLFTHAIGQPLLVHPVLGEALLGAYLSGAVDAPAPLVEGYVGTARILEGAGSPAATADGAFGSEVRVLNISGALVNRPAPGLCDPGPLSYEAIGDALDEAMADSNVKAVVMRMASPGGMAAGCFDLADRVFAARGPKPIYAMVDDYAYSACYGLAAACDEIWTSRRTTTPPTMSHRPICRRFLVAVPPKRRLPPSRRAQKKQALPLPSGRWPSCWMPPARRARCAPHLLSRSQAPTSPRPSSPH
jgi:hypothetical protein